MRNNLKKNNRFSSHSKKYDEQWDHITVLQLTSKDISIVNAVKKKPKKYYKFSPRSVWQLKSWFLRKAKNTQSFQSGVRWGFKDFKSSIKSKHNKIFCAVSCSASNILRLEGFIIYQFMEHQSEMLFLEVVGRSRRKGIGRFLLNSSLNHLAHSGIKSVFLEVAKTNRPAILLYRKQKFQVIGNRKNYYTFSRVKKVDALTMRRFLVATY